MAEIAYLQLTRRCNQVCRFCSNPPNGRLLPLERAKAWIDRFARKGYAGVILTGGEPTLHTEIEAIVRHARRRGIPPRIITNGQRTAEPGFLERLRDAGLDHLHVSIYSHRPEVQASLTGKKDSLACIERTLDRIGALGLRADANTVLNRYNAGHLGELAAWLIRRWPFLGHFVYNNLDPLMNRASENTDTIPRLRDFELELHRALALLESTGRSFRVERVPLCYMAEFAHAATETRKIVKTEGRAIFFLDEKRLRVQDHKGFWTYGKSPRCARCTLEPICAGLHQMDRYYSSEELCPVFVDRDAVIRRILGNGAAQGAASLAGAARPPLAGEGP